MRASGTEDSFGLQRIVDLAETRCVDQFHGPTIERGTGSERIPSRAGRVVDKSPFVTKKRVEER
jgi:hypothetical protein